MIDLEIESGDAILLFTFLLEIVIVFLWLVATATYKKAFQAGKRKFHGRVKTVFDFKDTIQLNQPVLYVLKKDSCLCISDDGNSKEGYFLVWELDDTKRIFHLRGLQVTEMECLIANTNWDIKKKEEFVYFYDGIHRYRHAKALPVERERKQTLEPAIG